MTNEASKVLTLVFTDLADSTALKREHGDQAVGDIIARHREYVTCIADESSGRVIDWAGDGCFLTFDTSSAGVMFALRLQQAHAEDENMPGVRIGLHMGEVTEKEGPQGPNGPPRIEGLAVDLAARIQGLAKPGQVLMSSSVYQSARQRLGVEAFGVPILWQAHGDYSIKGFDDALNICEAGLGGLSTLEAPEASEKAFPLVPIANVATPHAEVMPPDIPSPIRRYAFIAMFFVAIIGVTLGTDYVARMFSREKPPIAIDTGPITSLAVLPLDNLSNDADQGYFADGMTEAITAELAKIKSLKVISRTSAQRYRDTTLSLPEIASELNVDALIEGSVIREGDEVRITIQLIDARTDVHLLTESYENTVTSVLKLQSEVALAIADTLRAELSSDERERIADAREVNPEAYDVYLKAIDAMTDITPTGLFQVRLLFMQAAALDNEFAQAWGGVALANTFLGAYVAGPPRPFFDAAQDAAERALALDPTIGEAEAVLGMNHVYFELDWGAARNRFATAERLNPNSFFVLYLAGVYDVTVGDWGAAQTRADRILELNPYGTFPASGAAILLLNTGRIQQGIDILVGEVAKDPTNIQASLFLGWGRLAEGDYEAALSELNRVRAITGPIPAVVGLIAYAQALAGHDDEARAELERLSNSVAPEVLATSAQPWAYFALGEPDTAFEWLERGAAEPTGIYLSTLRNSPFTPEWQRLERLARIADDPRYWSLIERLGFPPLPPEHPGFADEQVWLAKKAAAVEANTPAEELN